MIQRALAVIDGKICQKDLPGHNKFVMPGVKWGKYSELFTPAYWVVQAWLDDSKRDYSDYRIGRNLKEEIVACVLGGYGIPAEIGLAAFCRLRDNNLINGKPPTENLLYHELTKPLKVNNKKVLYRFARQKSKYLAKILLEYSKGVPEYRTELEFREWLLSFNGIGFKTASWITRNWLGSDDVAIIDIHLFRAGVLAGFYNYDDDINKDYLIMEKKYLSFSKSINVKPSILDAIIWKQMKEAGKVIRGKLLGMHKRR